MGGGSHIADLFSSPFGPHMVTEFLGLLQYPPRYSRDVHVYKPTPLPILSSHNHFCSASFLFHKFPSFPWRRGIFDQFSRFIPASLLNNHGRQQMVKARGTYFHITKQQHTTVLLLYDFIHVFVGDVDPVLM